MQVPAPWLSIRGASWQDPAPSRHHLRLELSAPGVLNCLQLPKKLLLFLFPPCSFSFFFVTNKTTTNSSSCCCCPSNYIKTRNSLCVPLSSGPRLSGRASPPWPWQVRSPYSQVGTHRAKNQPVFPPQVSKLLHGLHRSQSTMKKANPKSFYAFWVFKQILQRGRPFGCALGVLLAAAGTPIAAVDVCKARFRLGMWSKDTFM